MIAIAVFSAHMCSSSLPELKAWRDLPPLGMTSDFSFLAAVCHAVGEGGPAKGMCYKAAMDLVGLSHLELLDHPHIGERRKSLLGVSSGDSRV